MLISLILCSHEASTEGLGVSTMGFLFKSWTGFFSSGSSFRFLEGTLPLSGLPPIDSKYSARSASHPDLRMLAWATTLKRNLTSSSAVPRFEYHNQAILREILGRPESSD